MNMQKFELLFLLFAVSKTFAGTGLFIPYNDTHLQYEGRIDMKGPDAANFYWSGTTVRISFKGTGIKALMDDERGQNYYNVIIDGTPIFKLKADSGKKWYSLAENLTPGKHTAELFKITQANKEYKRGFTRFYGFELDSASRLLRPPRIKKRKIEFYGNSITCGHSVEDSTGGETGYSKFENNYLSYAAITARHFNAQYSCIAKSGIGLMVSWQPLIMPEMFDRLNPLDSTSIWDFSRYQPDVVVINLFQNDMGILSQPAYAQYIQRFGKQTPDEEFIINAYKTFVQSIREKYNKAKIICCLGSMSATKDGSPWPGYVEKAVSELKDKKIYTHFFPYKKSPGHPRVKEQLAMANSLIDFIDDKIKW